ncbi:hypothetical protein V6N13_034365 [Hibiscus sabdariffa]|uniref:Uncharacterized protein n=1 Tax=Hibiscus sabdariffa TaxID=183260 RepID=A0ABR2P3S0_9ROSI
MEQWKEQLEQLKIQLEPWKNQAKDQLGQLKIQAEPWKNQVEPWIYVREKWKQSKLKKIKVMTNRVKNRGRRRKRFLKKITATSVEGNGG